MNKLPTKLQEEIKNIDGFFPFYIFDETILKSDLYKLKQAFGKYKTLIGYSYKTNYMAPLVKYLDNNGVFAELVSSFEVEIARKYGISASKVILNGPIKSYESVFKILDSGGLVNADSFDDLDLIKRVIKKLPKNKNIRVGVRIRFDYSDFDSRFGILINQDAINLLSNFLKDIHLKFFSCIHIHYPKRSINFFENKIKLFCEFISSNSHLTDIDNTILDIGGGLPSNMPKEVLKSIGLKNNYNLEKYGIILNNFREKFKLTNYKFLIEPGTCLAANCLYLVGNIHSINKSSNKTNINCDISKTLLGGISQKVSFPLEVISKKSDSTSLNFVNGPIYFSGFTCIENDIFGYSEEGLNISLKDKIILKSVGSYSAVFKSPFINGDIRLYSWDGEKLLLKRNAQTVDELISKYL